MRHPYESNSTYHLHEDNDCILETHTSLFIPVLQSSAASSINFSSSPSPNKKTKDENNNINININKIMSQGYDSMYIIGNNNSLKDIYKIKQMNSKSNVNPYLIELGPVRVSFELADVRIQLVNGSWMWMLRWFPRGMDDVNNWKNYDNDFVIIDNNKNDENERENGIKKLSNRNVKSKRNNKDIYNVFVRARSSLIQFDDNLGSQKMQHEILFEADYLLFSFRSFDEAKKCVDAILQFIDRTKSEKGAVTLSLSFDNSMSPYIQHGVFIIICFFIGLVLFLPSEETLTFIANQDMFTHVIKNCIRVVLSRYSLPIDRVSGMRVNTVSVANIEAGGRMNISLKSHKEYTLFIVVHDGDGIREIPLCFGRTFTNREQVMNAMKSLNSWLQTQLQTNDDILSELNENSSSSSSRYSSNPDSSSTGTGLLANLSSPTTITSRAPHRNSQNGSISLCVVCLSRSVKVALLPCKHACLCNICAEQLIHPQKCPVCRQLIKEKISLYF